MHGWMVTPAPHAQIWWTWALGIPSLALTHSQLPSVHISFCVIILQIRQKKNHGFSMVSIFDFDIFWCFVLFKLFGINQNRWGAGLPFRLLCGFGPAQLTVTVWPWKCSSAHFEVQNWSKMFDRLKADMCHKLWFCDKNIPFAKFGNLLFVAVLMWKNMSIKQHVVGVSWEITHNFKRHFRKQIQFMTCLIIFLVVFAVENGKLYCNFEPFETSVLLHLSWPLWIGHPWMIGHPWHQPEPRVQLFYGPWRKKFWNDDFATCLPHFSSIKLFVFPTFSANAKNAKLGFGVSILGRSISNWAPWKMLLLCHRGCS